MRPDIYFTEKNRYKDFVHSTTRIGSTLCILFIAGVFIALLVYINSHYDIQELYLERDYFLLTGYIIIVALPVFLMIIMFLSFRDIFLQVSVCMQGLYIKYPFSKSRLITWDKFQVVCIVRCNTIISYDYSPICFVRIGQKTDANGRWYLNDPFRYSKLIRVFDNEEMRHAISVCCPYKIIDLRKTSAYSPKSGFYGGSTGARTGIYE